MGRRLAGVTFFTPDWTASTGSWRRTFFRRSYSIAADVEIPEGGADGVLLAFGTSLAGYVLYVKDAKLVHEFIFSADLKYAVRSEIPVPTGRHTFRYDSSYDADGRGKGALFIDGAPVGTTEIPKTWPVRAVQGGLTCGRDTGLAISDAYQCPFNFAGTINSVVAELGEESKSDTEKTALAVWPPPLTR